CGAVAPEAIEAHAQLLEDAPEAGLLAITAPGLLHADWLAADRRRRRAGATGATAHIQRLLAPLDPRAALVTVIDGHPTTLSWLGSVGNHRVAALGVEGYGQSGDLPDL